MGNRIPQSRDSTTGNAENRHNNSCDFPKGAVEQSIPDRFEQVVEISPQHVAINALGNKITYQELNQASNRLARRILEVSGDSTEPVALVLRDSVHMIIAIFGVLKANKIYVPIDSTYPYERIAFMFNDSQAALVISDSESAPLCERLTHKEHHTINIDEVGKSVQSDNLALPITPSSRCAIFYTSGSSGQPKGIVQVHRNILHRAWVHASSNDVRMNDRQTSLFSLGFTASIPDIFGTLLSGATLYPYEVKTDGFNNLAQWLLQEKITIFHPPLGLLREFFGSLEGDFQFPEIRLVTLGGQSIYKVDIEHLHQHLSKKCKVEISLASTEASLHSQYFITLADEIEHDVLPVGFPVEDKDILILDENHRELGRGHVGEIAIRSSYLSPGYWQDEPLTQRKFILEKDGFNDRIYLSGDLGKMRADGCLEFFGREDSQVKIRGFRVGLTHIEFELQNLAEVEEAAVVAYKDRRGDDILAAYVVLAEDTSSSTRIIRKNLAMKLPEYMIPSAFHILDKLPRTPTGKVALSELPLKIQAQQDNKKGFVAPRDEVEIKLAGIWSSILGYEKISIADDFFDLGGQSLLAMRLFLEIDREFGRKLPISSLFRASTVQEMAELIRSEKPFANMSFLVPVQAQGSKPPFYCISPLGIDVLAYRDLALQMGIDQPFYALFSQGQYLDASRMRRVEANAKKYLEEIREIQNSGPYYLGGFSGGGMVALEMAHQLIAQGEDVPVVILLEAYGPEYPQDPSFLLGLTYRVLNSLTRIRRVLMDVIPWAKGHFEVLTGLDWPGKVAYIRYKGQVRANQIGRAVRRNVKRVFSPFSAKVDPVLETKVETRDGYKVPPYPGRVVLFRAENQPFDFHYDPLLGWGDILTGAFEIHEVPGLHDSILFGPRVSVLAEKLANSLSGIYEPNDSAQWDEHD